ncbi:hypothetical protein IT575_05405 [bacterium]|nr:hypothetical protein [bacterium]
MRHSWPLALAITIALVLVPLPFVLQHAQAADGDPSVASTDPYVLLDAAKLALADSKLEKAGRLLEAIPLNRSQAYVDEEVIFQRLLLEGAFLSSTTFLLETLARQELGQGKYAQWLAAERQAHAARFDALALDYLKRTEGGYSLSFVRFRLPEVNEEHLRDVELYSDPQVLLAAARNWEEGRDGLGRGLVLSQARVAVVLAAAVHYDLGQASATIIGASRRLAAGVPLRPAQTLDWIAETSQRNARTGDRLGELALACDLRLLALPAQQLPAELKKRAELRRNPPPPPPPPAEPKAKGKTKGKGKSNKGKR